MAKLLHFVKENRAAPGPGEFVWIAEEDGKDTIATYEADGYRLAGEADLDEDAIGGMPTERELS